MTIANLLSLGQLNLLEGRGSSDMTSVQKLLHIKKTAFKNWIHRPPVMSTFLFFTVLHNPQARSSNLLRKGKQNKPPPANFDSPLETCLRRGRIYMQYILLFFPLWGIVKARDRENRRAKSPISLEDNQTMKAIRMRYCFGSWFIALYCGNRARGLRSGLCCNVGLGEK